MIAAVHVDLVRVLLVVGVVVSSGCACALLAGRAARRRATSRVIRPALEIGSTSSILARANATATERSAASRPRSSADAGRPAIAAGQNRQRVDRSADERERIGSVAAEIALHIAENDPKRMAEVITQWIRTNENGKPPGKR